MKFFCDHMLGTLAKWLRIYGFDTTYAGSEIDDEDDDKAKEDPDPKAADNEDNDDWEEMKKENKKLKDLGLNVMRAWQLGLRDYLKQKKYI